MKKRMLILLSGRHKLILWLGVLVSAISTDAQSPRDHISDQIQAIQMLYDNQPDSAVRLMITLLNAEKEFNDSVKAEVYFLAGEVFDNVSVLTVSLDYHLKALELKQALGRTNLLRNYSEIFEIYASLRDYEKCVEYKKLINRELAKEGTYDLRTRAEANYDLGTFYWYFEMYDSSIAAMNKAITMVEEITPVDKEYLVYIKMELAEVFYHKGDFERMREILEEVKGDPQLVTYSRYARYYVLFISALDAFATGNQKESFDLCDSLLVEVVAMNLVEEEYNILGTVAEMHEQVGNYEEALAAYKKREQVYERMQDQEKRTLLEVLDTEYEVRNKNQQITFQESFIAQQRRVIVLISIAILLVAILSVILFWTYRRISKKNMQIETLMRELHHRVKNNLQVISSLLDLQSSKLTDPSAQKAVEEGQERIRAMSLIHQKLYQQNNVTEVNLGEYLTTLIKEIAGTYGYAKKVDLKVFVPSIPMDVDTTMPLGLIVNELVSNAFKYAFSDQEKPELEVQVNEERDGYFNLLIRDNGSGLPKNFDLQKANSFGLKLVRILTKQLGAQLEIDTKNGLTFHFKFQPSKKV